MNFNDLLPTILYTTAFAVLLIFLFIKKKGAISKFLVTVWLISSISAIIFQLLVPFYEKITYLPYLFLFSCFFISLAPIIRYENISEKFNYSQNNKILISVMWFFVIVSIVPFLENLHQVLTSTSSSNASAIADMYDSKMYGGGFKIDWLSSIGMLFNSLDGIFIQFLFFVPFYLLTQPKVSKTLLILMFLPLANHLLFQIAASGRGTAVLFIMNSIFFIFLFRKQIPEKRLRSVKIAGTCLLALIIAALSIITFARKEATNANDDNAIFIGYYIAKSHLDFNEKLWYIPVYTEGDNTFAFFKDIFGMDTFKSFLKKEAYWGPKIRISPGNFYTYVGDCYMDFGPIPTLLTFLCIAILAALYFSSNKKITIIRLFWFFAYCQVIMMGWSINYFKPYDATRNLLISATFLYLITVISSRKKLALSK